MAHPLMLENVWLHKQKFEDAEGLYRKIQAGTVTAGAAPSTRTPLADELAQVRKDINKALNKPPATRGAGGDVDDDHDNVMERLLRLEKDNVHLRKVCEDLRSEVKRINSLMDDYEAKQKNGGAPSSKPASKPAPPPADDDDDDDDDCDLFGSESEDEETKAMKEKRVQAYKEKKQAKPAIAAKSSVLLDVKPWDDETDMKAVEVTVRQIQMDGLVWGASKLVEVSFGIKKLSIMCVVEDEKVSIQDLQDRITEGDEEHVQSCDIAAFNKV